VLDFGWLVVSPLTTKSLAIFGADVVKLEFRGRPDALRMTGPYPNGRPSMDGSAPFVSINASKRSLGIDLNHPDAHALILRMACEADIICENFAPGTAARLGYDYETFRAIKPDVIMLSLSMQGQTGPRATQPGLGNHLQAMSGLDHVTGFPDGSPQGPNQVLPDFIGPGIALSSLLAALEHRRLTGEGQYIDISQLEAMMLYMQPTLIEHAVTGASPQRRGNISLTAAPHGVYPVQGEDRWIAIVVGSDAEWGRLHELLPKQARESLPADLPTHERLARRSELDAELARWSADWEGDALASALQERDIPAYIVCDGRDLLVDPQLAFREHYRFPEHGKLGPSLVDAPPFRISGLEPRLDAGPLYARDGVAVLEDWLGIDSDALSDLLASGAIAL
jgi:benzylsuccinate CoA-transferase BbsF subunit